MVRLTVFVVTAPNVLAAVKVRLYSPRSSSLGVHSKTPSAGAKTAPRGNLDAAKLTPIPRPSLASTPKRTRVRGVPTTSAGTVRSGKVAGSIAIEIFADSAPRRASRSAVPNGAAGSALISKRIRLCPARAPTMAGTLRLPVLLAMTNTVDSEALGALSRSSQPILRPPVRDG